MIKHFALQFLHSSARNLLNVQHGARLPIQEEKMNEHAQNIGHFFNNKNVPDPCQLSSNAITVIPYMLAVAIFYFTKPGGGGGVGAHRSRENSGFSRSCSPAMFSPLRWNL
jgi:hypothetical protein